MRLKGLYRTLFLAGWFAFLPETSLFAQNLVWEKEWGFSPNSEEIHKVCPAQDGNFFGLGTSSKFRQDYWGGTYLFPLIIKFDANGDTIFMKRIEVMNFNLCYIGHKYGDIYQVVFTTPQPAFKVCPVIVEFTESGVILETKIFTQLSNYSLSNGIRTPDHGLLFTGVGIGPGTNICGFKFNFLNELEWANAYFPPAQVVGTGKRVEPMANGNYLVSGILGRRIYGFEIDTAGNQIAQKQFYETPSNFVFWDAKAHQGFNKGSFSYGYYLDSSSNTVGYFGRHDSLGTKIWGEEELVTNVNMLVINRENSFIVAKNGFERTVERFTKDSASLWKVTLSTNSSGLRKAINGILFTEADTGIVYGYSWQQIGNAGNQFWMAKIAGVGTSYDPTNPGDTVTVSAEERIFRPKDAPVLYPNPVCESFQFSRLTQESMLAVYSMKGEKLFEKPMQPGEKINATNLPKGIYLYHLQMGKKVFTGKILKE
jgi:hypothetical protein